MKHTAQDILNYVEDNDVKFVRLAFCDIFGRQKIIAIQPSLLASAFAVSYTHLTLPTKA